MHRYPRVQRRFVKNMSTALAMNTKTLDNCRSNDFVLRTGAVDQGCVYGPKLFLHKPQAAQSYFNHNRHWQYATVSMCPNLTE